MNITKKLFTLIELITVIVVLGILAAIVIPNISSFKEEAKEKAILADARNIQTAVDMYSLDFNGATPTKEKATLGNPQIIEIYGMKPDYLRDAPKDNGAKFWLDSNSTVWASMVDAPTNVEYGEGKLTWETVDGAELYKIYKTEDATTASVKKSTKMTFIESVNASESLDPSKALPELIKGTYLVTAIDMFDFESAPTKVGTVYSGYGNGPDKEVNFNVEIPTIPANQKPVAVMSMSPESNINTATSISWSYENSNDPDSDEIVKAEWRLNNVVVDSMPLKLPLGTQVVELRVQDSKDEWSEWVSKQVIVSEMPSIVYNFNYLGNNHTYVIPESGTYKLEVWGAKGGGNGGNGGYTYGEKYFTKGQTLYVYVGGVPSNNIGGWNGGGPGNASYSSGGGGATDFRTVNGSWSHLPSLSSRIIVAGGGGGGTISHSLGQGGDGGGLIGETPFGGIYAGQGGTQNAGGAKAVWVNKIMHSNYPHHYSGGNSTYGSNAANSGGFGFGGSNTGTYANGGGGGWYGGGSGSTTGNGGGGSTGCATCGTVYSAGGGSSYYEGLENKGMQQGVNATVGKAKITYVGN